MVHRAPRRRGCVHSVPVCRRAAPGLFRCTRWLRASISLRAPSRVSARAAQQIVPARILSMFILRRPLKRIMPSPPALIVAAMVAMPTVEMHARRTPAMMAGRARGSCTLSSTCESLRPMPRAASISAGSTPRIPSRALRTSMNWLYTTMTMTALVKPNPVRGMSRANSARLGMAYAAPRISTTASPSGRLRRQATVMSAAMAQEMSMVVPSSMRCSAVASNKSSACVTMYENGPITPSCPRACSPAFRAVRARRAWRDVRAALRGWRIAARGRHRPLAPWWRA